MAEVCGFPGCKRVAEKNGYCVGHRIYAGDKIPDNAPMALKRQVKPVAKRGEKLRDEMKLYKKEVKAYLAQPEHQHCKIQAPGCRGAAVAVNHLKRRGKNLRIQKYWEACCAPCNTYIEEHPAWAYENGHLISVHTKITNDDVP